MVARRNFPKRNIFEQKTQKILIICQIDWHEVGVAFELQCLRNCTLSSLSYYTNFCCVCVVVLFRVITVYLDLKPFTQEINVSIAVSVLIHVFLYYVARLVRHSYAQHNTLQ